MFDEEENSYIKDGDKTKFVGSNFDSVESSFGRKHRRKGKSNVQNNNDSSEDSDTDEDDEEDKRKLAKRSQEFRAKMSEYLSNEGKFQNIPNISTPDYDSQSRHSIEFFDDEEDGRRHHDRGHLSNRSSYRNLDASFISPRTNLNESFSSRPSRLESIPEAWLVFPGDNKQLNNSHNNTNNNPINSRLSKAIPVSLRHGIGSRLQVSTTNTN